MDTLSWWYFLGLTLLSYIIGAIPFGWLICKLVKGIDIRKEGSGSIGATNVGRALGRWWSILVFLLDVSKGVLVVLLGKRILGEAEAALVLGLMTVVGHCYSVFLRFRGGKGVATALGVALATSPVIAVCAFVLWGIILAISRYVSLASMLAITAFALASLFFSGPWIGCNFLALALFIVYTHWPNIKRMRAGTEPKVGSKKGGANG